jgi:hypothetical protein
VPKQALIVVLVAISDHRPHAAEASRSNGRIATFCGAAQSLPRGDEILPCHIEFFEFGEPEVLTFVEAEAGKPGPDEVLIRIRAIGLNRAEAMFRRNEYIKAPTLPAVLGSEAAGTVVAVGQNVTHVSAGNDVNIVPGFPLGDDGSYGEIATAPARAVIAKLPTSPSKRRHRFGPCSSPPMVL